jgi:hypothetical protein
LPSSIARWYDARILMRNCCLFLVAGRSCDVDFWMGVEGERDLKHYTEGEGGAKKK